MKALMFKFGIAIAVSAVGYVAAKLSFKPRRPFAPSSPVGIGLEAGDEHGIHGTAAATCVASRCLEDQLRILRNEEALAQIFNGTFTVSSTPSTAALAEPTPSTKNSSEEEGFLLPEFNKLISEEFDTTRQGFETISTGPMLIEPESKDERALEQEITQLKDMVWFLKERERNLEIKLLEYSGVKEKETAAREIENRLKISKVEAQLLSMKVESLQAENERLRVQVSEYSRMMTELEAAKAKIKLLKKKLKVEGEQAKEKIASLQQRISTLEERDVRDGGDAAVIERKVKELEEEAARVKRMNSQLSHENSNLAKKLESTNIIASSLPNGLEAKALEEASHMREVNNKLTKEMEQLQTDRCADVEELVYLRWINACLRYELRNYQPPKGKTVAMDLSKSLSPKSEQKAKQLILEYANSGLDDKCINLLDFDSENGSSSSQASNSEAEDTLSGVPSTTKNCSSSKSKFFSRLKKLVRGKGSHRNKASLIHKTPTSCDNFEGRIYVSSCSSEDIIGIRSYDSNSSCIIDDQHRRAAWSQSFSRPSSETPILPKLDLNEIKRRKGVRSKSDMGIAYCHRRIISEEDGPSGLNMDSLIGHEDDDDPENAKLKKFAKALQNSCRKPKLNKRASFNYY